MALDLFQVGLLLAILSVSSVHAVSSRQYLAMRAHDHMEAYQKAGVIEQMARSAVEDGTMLDAEAARAHVTAHLRERAHAEAKIKFNGHEHTVIGDFAMENALKYFQEKYPSNEDFPWTYKSKGKEVEAFLYQKPNCRDADAFSPRYTLNAGTTKFGANEEEATQNQLSFGEIVALAGDFYGDIHSPISETHAPKDWHKIANNEETEDHDYVPEDEALWKKVRREFQKEKQRFEETELSKDKIPYSNYVSGSKFPSFAEYIDIWFQAEKCEEISRTLLDTDDVDEVHAILRQLRNEQIKLDQVRKGHSRYTGYYTYNMLGLTHDGRLAGATGDSMFTNVGSFFKSIGMGIAKFLIRVPKHLLSLGTWAISYFPDDIVSQTYRSMNKARLKFEEYVPYVNFIFMSGRYLKLANNNQDHFMENANIAYRACNYAAIRKAMNARDLWYAKNENHASEVVYTMHQALALNAWANHFYSDKFAAGHTRTPREDSAKFCKRLKAPFSGMLGGLLAKAMHDEDNQNGLLLMFNGNHSQQWVALGDSRYFDDIRIQGLGHRRIDEGMMRSVSFIWDTFFGNNFHNNPKAYPCLERYMPVEVKDAPYPIKDNFANFETIGLDRNYEPLMIYAKEQDALIYRTSPLGVSPATYAPVKSCASVGYRMRTRSDSYRPVTGVLQEGWEDAISRRRLRWQFCLYSTGLFYELDKESLIKKLDKDRRSFLPMLTRLTIEEEENIVAQFDPQNPSIPEEALALDIILDENGDAPEDIDQLYADEEQLDFETEEGEDDDREHEEEESSAAMNQQERRAAMAERRLAASAKKRREKEMQDLTTLHGDRLAACSVAIEETLDDSHWKFCRAHCTGIMMRAKCLPMCIRTINRALDAGHEQKLLNLKDNSRVAGVSMALEARRDFCMDLEKQKKKDEEKIEACQKAFDATDKMPWDSNGAFCNLYEHEVGFRFFGIFSDLSHQCNQHFNQAKYHAIDQTFGQFHFDPIEAEHEADMKQALANNGFHDFEGKSEDEDEYNDDEAMGGRDESEDKSRWWKGF